MPVVCRPTPAPSARSDSRRSLGLQLRLIREIANAALAARSGEFERLYPPIGRGSIPPERLMRALLLQAFYSIRSEDEIRAPLRVHLDPILSIARRNFILSHFQ
jgi:hypothetical protein